MSDPIFDEMKRDIEAISAQIDRRDAEIARLKDKLIAEMAANNKMRNALLDMLSGWRYIRATHGDLYGVGWDRAQKKAESALEQV